MAPKTKPASVNEPPVAHFTYDPNNLTVVFNATESNDPDGSISNYSWTFGDDTAWFGKVVTHVYPMNGTYTANLTVTDNGGAKNSTEKELTVKKTVTPVVTSKPPKAVIKIVSIVDLTVSLSAENSNPAPGMTITSYAWTFGDGASATGVTTQHTYAASGTYTVTLTVTDSDGATDSAAVEVVVPTTPPTPGNPPTAVIKVVSVVNLTVKLSGEDSTPAQGTVISSYAWSFGDGTTGTGVSVTHSYAKNGTYKVTLTVTDRDGGKDSTSVEIKVSSTSPPPPPHPHPQGPPGLLHAIEIHEEKAVNNGGLKNSLNHLETNLDRWVSAHGISP